MHVNTTLTNFEPDRDTTFLRNVGNNAEYHAVQKKNKKRGEKGSTLSINQDETLKLLQTPSHWDLYYLQNHDVNLLVPFNTQSNKISQNSSRQGSNAADHNLITKHSPFTHRDIRN